MDRNKNSELVNIRYSGSADRDCYKYDITKKKDFTVREFIDDVIESKEWGVIEIKHESRCYNLDYSDCEADCNNIPEDIMNMKVKNLDGSGGWGRSDFYLEC